MSTLLDNARAWLQGLSPRDRRALQVGSIVLLVMGLIGGVLTLQERSAAAQERVRQREALLATLPASLDHWRRNERLGADAALPLGTLVRRLAALHGLVAAVEIGTDGAITVALDGAPFDAVLELVAEFEAQRLTLARARIERATQAGAVNARFELGPRAASPR